MATVTNQTGKNLKKLGEALPTLNSPTKEQTMTSQSNDEQGYTDKQEQRRCHDLWALAGIDDRHAHCKWDNLNKHEKWFAQYHKANRIVNNGEIALFLGDRGNGKTQCAIELIRMACKIGKLCRYVRCREVGMKLREAYGQSSGLTELQAVNNFVRPHLLVIDECQERMDTDFEARSFSLILDKRYGAMKPTILIANCDQKAMVQIIGSSVCDRVKEGGGALLFDWPSFRHQKQGDSDGKPSVLRE